MDSGYGDNPKFVCRKDRGKEEGFAAGAPLYASRFGGATLVNFHKWDNRERQWAYQSLLCRMNPGTVVKFTYG